MKPASFEYHRPASIDEALGLLATHGAAAKLIAGGQSLVPMMNMRLASPAQLVDINDLSELARVRLAGELIEVGALARHQEIANSALVRAQCPLLAQAVRTIGHLAIRHRGTAGGSLVHADPAAQHALVAVTLDAQLTLARQGGVRTVPAGAFLQSAMSTDLGADEMLVAASYPRCAPGEVSAFRMFNLRHGDFAIAAAAVTMAFEEGRATGLRLGVAAGEPVPARLDAVTERFRGERPTPRWIAQLARAAREAVAPEDHPRIPADYRKELLETLVARALTRCVERASETST